MLPQQSQSKTQLETKWNKSQLIFSASNESKGVKSKIILQLQLQLQFAHNGLQQLMLVFGIAV